MPALTSLRTALAPCIAALVLTFPASAGAASSTFAVRSIVEPTGTGLAVTGPLSGFVAGSNARVMAPTSWRSQATSAGRLRLRTTQNQSCHYTLTYTVKSLLGPVQPAADRVAAGLPAASARHLLDSGARGNAAFRVVRQPGIGGRVRVDALWSGVLTKRADIAPSGQAAWTEIRVAAISGKGDECHAGTWRESLGPTIGDSLAVARTRLHFTRTG